jgi:hypothetical protein
MPPRSRTRSRNSTCSAHRLEGDVMCGVPGRAHVDLSSRFQNQARKRNFMRALVEFSVFFRFRQ